MQRICAVLLLMVATTVTADETSNKKGSITLLQHKSPGISQAENEAISEISLLAQQRNIDGAFLKLKPILLQCESRSANSDKQMVYFEEIAEFVEYASTNGKNKDLVWVQDSCPKAYKMAAFLYIEKEDNQAALSYLDKAMKLAPYWAEPYTELAFIHKQTKDYKSAKAAFEKAIELADKYPSSAHVKPLALRGLGIVLVDLEDLDAAKAALNASLVLEPNNKLALSELEYIRQVEAEK
ncbi:MAG: tetratricopeptide repeat protein [Arenimonas sp.]